MASFIQSNTQEGIVVKLANQNLSTYEGYLATITTVTAGSTVTPGTSVQYPAQPASSGSNAGQAILAVVGSVPLYVITEGGDGAGHPVSLQPLTPSRNVRIISSATMTAGTQVAANASGQIRAAINGDYVIGLLEEDTINGAYALVRPAYLGIHA